MSWQAAEWMDKLAYDAMKPLAARVLLKLANVAAQDGTRAYRNVWEVAAELGVDRRSVQRALRELQAADLVRPGDQRAVAHLNPSRRPTVWNLNFDYHRLYALPEIPFPDADDEADEPGATELSTGEPGATFGATAEVPLGTNGTTYLTLNETALVLEHAQAHEGKIDASGDTQQPAAATGSPFAMGWVDDRCPANYRGTEHELGSYGNCIHCYERPIVVNGHAGMVNA